MDKRLEYDSFESFSLNTNQTLLNKRQAILVVWLKDIFILWSLALILEVGSDPLKMKIWNRL